MNKFTIKKEKYEWKDPFEFKTGDICLTDGNWSIHPGELFIVNDRLSIVFLTGPLSGSEYTEIHDKSKKARKVNGAITIKREKK